MNHGLPTPRRTCRYCRVSFRGSVDGANGCFGWLSVNAARRDDETGPVPRLSFRVYRWFAALARLPGRRRVNRDVERAPFKSHSQSSVFKRLLRGGFQSGAMQVRGRPFSEPDELTFFHSHFLNPFSRIIQDRLVACGSPWGARHAGPFPLGDKPGKSGFFASNALILANARATCRSRTGVAIQYMNRFSGSRILCSAVLTGSPGNSLDRTSPPPTDVNNSRMADEPSALYSISS